MKCIIVAENKPTGNTNLNNSKPQYGWFSASIKRKSKLWQNKNVKVNHAEVLKQKMTKWVDGQSVFILLELFKIN